jgi:membrane fusion protein, copper/silver efflux system
MKRTLTFAGVAIVLAVLGACREGNRTPDMDPMAGMDMGGPADSSGERAPVRLSVEQARAIGITFAVVERGPLTRLIRAVGQIIPAEPALVDVTPKVDGFVDRLFVDATGRPVRKGEPLLALYSPMLVAAQEELLTALRLAAALDSTSGEAWRNAQTLVAASRRRLAYWDISAGQIARLEQTGEVTKTLTLTAPIDGVVLEKMVVAGQAVMPGMKLYRLADLSTVWIEGEVFEQDLAFIRLGAAARVELAAYAGRTWRGRVSFVSPVVDEQSRTARVRVELRNRAGTLRPGMYGTLFFDAALDPDRLSVPAEAVVMTGEHNLVFVVQPDGALVPREVTLGARGDGRIQILSGVAAGDRIVASANFLVDAESRLATDAGKAAMPGMNMDTEKRP